MTPKLLVFARPEPGEFLRSRWPAGRKTVALAELPADGCLERPLRELPAAVRRGLRGILVVADPACPPATAAPGPCLAGVPIGVACAEEASALLPWLAALEATRRPPATPAYYVLSMWKPFYLAWAERFVAALRAGYGDGVAPLFADSVSRVALCRRLAEGPQLALYVGHGRSRGWSGYRGLRWHHLAGDAPARPVGAVVALTCDNLKPGREGAPAFGVRWVAEGRAGAFLGATDALAIPPLETIGAFFLAAFAGGRCRTIGELIAAVDGCVAGCGETAVQASWAMFRLAGNPLQPLTHDGRFGVGQHR